MFSEVSKTKKASPPSPSFMEKVCFTWLTVNSTFAIVRRLRGCLGTAELTFLSDGLNNENLPNLTWKGEHANDPDVL